MNYIFQSQNSQSQPMFSQYSQQPVSSQTTQFCSTTTRPSLLLARNQLEQRQKEKNERKRMKQDTLKAAVQQTQTITLKLKRKKEMLQKVQSHYHQILEELLLSYNEQNVLLMKLFDECKNVIKK